MNVAFDIDGVLTDLEKFQMSHSGMLFQFTEKYTKYV